MGDVARVGEEVFREAAVPRVAAELCLGTDGLPGRQAILAVATGRVEPGHPDAVALLDDRHPRSRGDDPSDALMARNERERGLERPVAARGMKIGVAHAAGLGLDQDLASSRRGNIPLL
jgi:hypothetical protein